jgi:membrane-bound serine protease (ClpP class)
LETEQIADRLRDLTWAATVAYIPREALSGAAIMSLPCDEVILGPNAEYGDAGAIYQAEGFMFRYADEKFTTALASRVRALADSAGRPAALAEAMVDKDLIVYQVRHRDSGQETCMSQEEIDASPDPERWEVLRPIHESRKGRFFQVTGKRAVELGLADAVANSHDDLKERFALADDFIVLDETFADRFAVFLNHPLVTGLLFIVGLVALYVEFLSPGLGLGGVVSVLCFGLFFWSRFWGGTGDWLEVILFLLGLGLLGVEMFVLPGFGVWGLTGLLLVVVSLIMASEEFVIPQSPSEISSLQFNALVALGAIVLFVVIAGALTVSLNRIPGLSNMALGLPPPASARQLTSSAAALGSAEPSAAPRGPQVGDRGIADSALRPSGKARFGDDYYDVTTEGLYVDAGATVRVIQVQGRNIVVRNCS